MDIGLGTYLALASLSLLSLAAFAPGCAEPNIKSSEADQDGDVRCVVVARPWC